MLDEFTARRVSRLRKVSESVMNRVSKPILTESEYIDIQAHILGEIKSHAGRIEFIVDNAEAVRKSIVNALRKNGLYDAAQIASEVKITPWL
jgi:hypothetical protein